jgi:hypothetical protein
VTDREVVPGCAQVRIKYAEKTSVGLWGYSRDPRELPGVTGPCHKEAGVLHLVSELTLAVIRHGRVQEGKFSSWTGVDR